MSSRAFKKFPWAIYIGILGFIILLALAPLLSALGAGWVANAHGCRLDEGSAHPCVIDGKDYGQTLYTFGVLGWLMLLTLPGGALATVIWAVALLVHRASWRKRALS